MDGIYRFIFTVMTVMTMVMMMMMMMMMMTCRLWGWLKMPQALAAAFGTQVEIQGPQNVLFKVCLSPPTILLLDLARLGSLVSVAFSA